MIVNTTTEDICRRVCSSVLRVVKVDGLRCVEEDGKLILHGQVATRDDSMMCMVVARSVPGADKVANKIKVVR